MTRKPKRNRRGALLLVVLSMLVLFALIALTFVVVAGSFNRSAKSAGRIGLTDDEGKQLIERAFLEIVRGTTNTNIALLSVDASDPTNQAKMIAQCLLEDLYGPFSIRGTVTSVDSTSFPGFVVLTGTGSFTAKSDYYSGQVLTMLDGPCGLLSTRILRFDHTSNSFWLDSFTTETGATVAPANSNTFLINGRPFSGIAGNPTAGVLGSANEDYDAPDANNPFLAHIPSATTQSSQIIGSFLDRPYAPLKVDANTDNIPDLRVDNDGDGIADSLWVDIGLPIKTAPDGIRYKGFVAYLCTDLDGRANLNAHGSLAQLTPQHNTTATGDVTAAWANTDNNGSYSASGTKAVNTRPRGIGMGPADIDLKGLLSTTTYPFLLQERYRSKVSGDQVPGIVGNDPQGYIENYRVPDDFTTLATTPGAYGDWVDMHGLGFIGVDTRGMPMAKLMGAGQMTDPPYESNWVNPNGSDTPYTASDLEGILRYQDVDSKSLSQRLVIYAAPLVATNAARRSVTTASFRIPVPSTPQHIIDRVSQRMSEAGTSYNAAAISKMLPFEVLQGGKMDLNRMWGNGQDNNSNGVVDEPGELSSAETLYAEVYGGSGVTANYINGADSSLNPAQGRHLFVRNLFCLMMFLMDKDPSNASRIAYRIPLSGAPFGPVETSLTSDQLYDLTVRRIAQWAINVVDCRDPDAIMTPFEYDINPFNGWNVDGIVDDGSGSLSSDDTSTDRRLVWGMEHPDVLMTESLAFHDRRVRDTEWDDRSDATNEDDHPDDPARGTKRIHPDKVADPMSDKMGDKTLDQVRIPEGSLFLEFHNTRNRSANNPVYPREIYDANGRLDLARKEPSAIFPIWRVAISVAHHTGKSTNASSFQARRAAQPDSTNWQPEKLSLINNSDALALERFVWFTNTAPTTGTHQELASNTYYNKANRSALIAPGEYLVVGPRAVTYVGAKPASSDASAPVVTLDGDQKLDLSGSGIDYTNLDGTSNYPLGSTVNSSQIAVPKTIYAVTDATGYPNDVSGLNVTEPLPTATNRYPNPTHDRNSVRDAYGDGTTPTYLDQPLDSRDNRPLSTAVDDLLDRQTVSNYRTAILQRLANPLLPFHAVTNPYITVDWTPIDVTIFNGEDRKPETWDQGANGDFDPDDNNPQTPRFGSRERSTDNFSYLLWTPPTPPAWGGNVEPTDSTEVNAADECFRYDLVQAAAPRDGFTNSTLGYLNSGFYGSPWLPPIPGPLTNPAGDPPAPNPWITWPDRPFVNQFDLLTVPFTSSADLLHRLSAQNFDNPVDPTFELRMPFAHLLNFYHSGSTGHMAPHFYRLLEYVEVPSRFAGTHRWQPQNPSTFVPLYSAPFHKASRFRDPGLVNVNTVPGTAVWSAVAEDAFTSWTNLDASRRTPPLSGTSDPLGRFNNPFRSAWSSTTATDANRTMMRYSDAAFGPLMGSRTSAFDKHIDPGIHPYFYFQGLSRQASLLTTQSNVYAIWITVGYFEVNDAGVYNGKEYGVDSGNVRRHRGFYIFDRSVPVAYERGRDHNVERGVMLRRYIE